MSEGFGKYVGTGTVRTKELFRRIEREGVSDPEDIMLIIMDIFKEEVLYPEPGKFYTFLYNPKTPEIEYDQHPLIACTSLEKWGFKGFEFNVNNKKLVFNPGEAAELKRLHSNPASFIGKFLDESGMIKDAAGYHKALAVAMNPERFAKYFYEQGAADAADDFMRKTKNIN